ncbi:hypothetical protein LCGC14_1914860 [marine sediment metagenome]|uniref:HicB-like antitoxin of toxin-antitoxin system domain-containing protein n=1 Tax=marine sediment metagenome TaxID=412755 RepID=A0A0F9FT71_9ZZZZ
MRLQIRIDEIAPGKVRATCLTLPGCVVYGATPQEAQRKISLAVAAYLASLNACLPCDAPDAAQSQEA